MHEFSWSIWLIIDHQISFYPITSQVKLVSFIMNTVDLFLLKNAFQTE